MQKEKINGETYLVLDGKKDKFEEFKENFKEIKEDYDNLANENLFGLHIREQTPDENTFTGFPNLDIGMTLPVFDLEVRY